MQRRRLASASPAVGAGDWRPRPRSPRPDRRQLNHIPLPTTWVLNDVFVMYAAQKMPGNVLSTEMLLEIQSIEARIRATPGFDEHCVVRHDDHASYSVGSRVCAPPIGRGDHVLLNQGLLSCSRLGDHGVREDERPQRA